MQEPQVSLFGPTPFPEASTLSKRAFGERIGVSPGRVSQLIAAGLPVNAHGRIGVQEGLQWIEANLDSNRRRAKLNGTDGATSPAFGQPATPKAAKDVADAKLATLKADRMEGRLMDRAAALRAVEGRAKMERDSWISWVNRVGPLVAGELGADLAVLTAALDREVRAQLVTLSDTPLRLPK